MSEISRRRFLEASLGAPALFAGMAAAAAAPPDRRFAPFDQLLEKFIEANKVPGAALAITRNRRLVYSRGYGLADLDKRLPVKADSLFRIASISKPLTSAAILQLAEADRLRLDDPVLDHISLKPLLAKGMKMDPRWRRVTIRHCLHHTGGWDRNKSYDPIGIPKKIAAALGTKPPVSARGIVRYMMGQPLDFDPGQRFAYSNLGYLLLGRAIESAAGRKYEGYVKAKVLAPLGIRRMQLGRALPEHRAKDEVHYYDARGKKGPCLYPPHVGEETPFPDGAKNFEGYEAHGGWIASAIDLVKFASAFDAPATCPILSEASINTLWERPPGLPGFGPKGKPRASYYGCGWNVRPIGKSGQNTWHTGLISGTSTILVRRSDGLNWAVLFNTDSNPKGKVLAGLIDPLLHKAADEAFKKSD